MSGYTLLFFLTAVSFGPGKVKAQGDSLFTKTTYTQFMLSELATFIEAVKPKSIGNGMYNVYMVRFHDPDSSSKPFGRCFTLGHLFNNYSLKYLSADYFFQLDSELVALAGNLEGLWTDTLKLAPFYYGPLRTQVDSAITKKLYVNEDFGGITGIARGQISCWWSEERTSSRFFKNSDDIPRDSSIYTSFPSGFIIEEVESRSDEE